jgi:predicted transcriptional regulator of viral defense system
MDNINQIKDIFLKNNGFAKTSDITSAGIHNRALDRLMQEGRILKLKRGLYQWIEDNEADELAILKALLPESILCMNSALYHYGYTDRTPDCYHIALDRNCNKNKLRFNYPYIKPYFLMKKYLEIGVHEILINGVKINIFDKERTICDVVRYSNKIDREIINKAIQSYVNDSSRNIGKLIEYSKELRIYNKVQMWIGMWL